MTYRTIRDALAAILLVEEETIRPETKLWGAVDAVSVAKLVLFCEDRFRVTIRDERVSTFSSLIDLVRHVEALMEDGRDGYRQPTESGREAWYYE
jgi:acyl carrier protein